MTRSERIQHRADAARRRAEQASEQARAMMDRIPPGQPIIDGRDRRYRDRAWDKVGAAASATDEAERLEASAQRVGAYERRLEAAQAAHSIEGVAVGDEVIACFTNCGRDYRFRGRIMGRTINVWNVETLGADAPYGEAPGRVFQIPALGRPRSSARNRVYRLAEEPQ